MRYNSARYFKMPYSKKLSAIALCLVALNGCNSEEVTSPLIDNTEEENHAQLITPRTFVLSQPGIETTLNVKTIYSGRGLTVKDVVSNGASCKASISTLQGSEVTMQSPAGSYCQYTLDVSAEGQRQSHFSKVQSFSSSADEPLIGMKIGNLDEHGWIDVEQALGEQWPVGYKLARVLYEDDSANLYNTQLVGNLIHLNADEFEGFAALRYVLENVSYPNEPKTGVLVVAKEERNNKIVISKPFYDLTGKAGFRPKMFEEMTVDLTQLPEFNVTADIDWQLAYVYSTDSSVMPLDKENVANKSLTFVASTPGVHQISYVVQNQYNDMALGSFSVYVSPVEKAITWKPVTLNNVHTGSNKTFPGPVLFSAASLVASTIALWDANVANTFAGFDNVTAAETLCSTKGRVPFAYELEDVYKASLAGKLDISSWPKSKPYLVYSADKSSEQAFDLATGTLRDKETENEVLNMTCLEFQELMIQNTVTTFPVHQKTQLVILTKKTLDSEYDFSVVSNVLDDSNVTYEIKPIDEAERQFAVYGTANKGGVFKLKVTDRDDENNTVQSRVLAAVGKWNELQFSDDVTMSNSNGKPYLLDNNKDVLEVGIRMVDNEGYGIPDKSFSVDTRLQLLSKPWQDWSNLEGYTSFKVRTQGNMIPAGRYETTVPATVKKDTGIKTINIPVYSKNYYHTIDVQHIGDVNGGKEFQLSVKNGEGRAEPQDIKYTIANNETHVVLVKKTSGVSRINPTTIEADDISLTNSSDRSFYWGGF
ncbi:hypothetical protein [Photobacterium leiognathi]|uniref:hypothetical protein n=1 Tax=Photobacterium leiognathi TaxID=553611 RepID=UPI0027384125|nr:hypothetical protein [Photobacterium leiognathi]